MVSASTNTDETEIYSRNAPVNRKNERRRNNTQEEFISIYLPREDFVFASRVA